jgi:hypothetical protein
MVQIVKIIAQIAAPNVISLPATALNVLTKFGEIVANFNALSVATFPKDHAMS